MVALAHFDAGSGESTANRALADRLLPLILPLLCRDAVLVSDPAFADPDLMPLPLPPEVAPGRYHLYRFR